MSLIAQSPVTVMLADVVSGLAVIGIAVLLFPIFRQVSKNITFIYLLLKGTEGVLMIIAGILFLNAAHQYLRSMIYEAIHIYPFIFAGLFLYYLMYRTKIVPRFIAVWGFIAILVLSVRTVLVLFGIYHDLLDAMMIPIISNEIFLAFWLF